MAKHRVLLGYAVDIFGPLLVWWVTRRLGISAFWGLNLGLALTLLSTAINTFRRRKLDAVGVLVLLELAASIVLLVWFDSPRVLLIRPSIFSGIAAFYLMGSAFTSRPLTLEGSRPMATKGDPVRTVAWEKAWQQVPRFRLAHRVLTFCSGAALLADAGLRVVLINRYPLGRALALETMAHIAVGAIFLVAWVKFGRWAGPLVDGIQRELTGGALAA